MSGNMASPATTTTTHTPSTLGETAAVSAAVASSEIPSEERMFYASLFSHGLAALAAKLVSAPMDRARILLQTSPGGKTFPSVRNVLANAQGHHYTAVHIHLLHMAGTTWIRHYLSSAQSIFDQTVLLQFTYVRDWAKFEKFPQEAAALYYLRVA
ncbi:hypothetical protein FOL47_008691 [Perkinsus chesapeaki]|uniref:Uncharacterized protein n=1 Tax=Perkinsus chesapeaki TaxID=330153 RepID=A0A7J6MTB0_PERCH|nr:hypothetical protein FOL47_008691 [Perkinsus chesapeaki]